MIECELKKEKTSKISYIMPKKGVILRLYNTLSRKESENHNEKMRKNICGQLELLEITAKFNHR